MTSRAAATALPLMPLPCAPASAAGRERMPGGVAACRVLLGAGALVHEATGDPGAPGRRLTRLRLVI